MARLGEVVRILELIPDPPSAEDFAFPVEESILNLFRFSQAGTPFFQNPLSGPISECIADINGAIGELGRIQQSLPAGPVADQIGDISEFLGDVAGTLGDWNAHINNTLVGELNTNPGFLSQIENSIRIRAAQNAIANVLNACEDLIDYMGSILGEGQGLFNQLVEPLTQIVGSVAQGAGAAIAAFQQFRDEVLAATAAIVDQIQKEIANIANALADAVAWALANAISSLVDDPCAAAVINAAGTTVLLNNLPNLPRFP